VAKPPVSNLSGPDLGEKLNRAMKAYTEINDQVDEINDRAEKINRNVERFTGNKTVSSYGGSKSGIQITVRRLDVAVRKSNGKHWDAGSGKPDLRVTIKKKGAFRGFKGITSQKEDTYTTTFNETIVGADKGDELFVSVSDGDLAGSDYIGETSFTINSEMIRQGRVTLIFDQVEELVLDLK